MPLSKDDIKCSQANSQKRLEQEALTEFFRHHSTKSFFDMVIENYDMKQTGMMLTKKCIDLTEALEKIQAEIGEMGITSEDTSFQGTIMRICEKVLGGTR